MRWAALSILSVAAAGLLQYLHLPAAFLLGPMIAAIFVGLKVGGLRLHALLKSFAQAAIGCMIARAMTPSILASFSMQWPLFLSVVTSIILAACALGWLFSRLKILPGTTAVWGLLPGAASVMMIMAEDYGADARLVAFMQYLRVVCVATVASLLACFWAHVPAHEAAPIIWFGQVKWAAFAETLLIALLGVAFGQRSKVPAGTMLLPLFLGGFLNLKGIVAIELPQWLLAISYCLLGWSIGLSFTRDVLATALKLVPQTLAAIFLLISFSALLACILVKLMGIDPLTAYLATSPGGMDSIAIIAASSTVDFPFIIALQTVRFLLVLALGPPTSRLVANSLSGTGKTLTAETVHNTELIAHMREDESGLD